MRQSTTRSEIVSNLDAIPGRDLVLVDNEGYPVHVPLIYNEPEISDAQIFWANRLGPEKDALMITYFSDRVLWDVQWEKGGSYKLIRPSQPEQLAGSRAHRW